MNYKKEFKKLNNDAEYLRELRIIDAEEYAILEAKLAEAENAIEKLDNELAVKEQVNRLLHTRIETDNKKILYLESQLDELRKRSQIITDLLN